MESISGPLANSTPELDRKALAEWFATKDIPRWPGCAPYVPTADHES